MLRPFLACRSWCATVHRRLYLQVSPAAIHTRTQPSSKLLASAATASRSKIRTCARIQRTARWISASQSLTTTMLEGADEEEALGSSPKTVREVRTPTRRSSTHGPWATHGGRRGHRRPRTPPLLGHDLPTPGPRDERPTRGDGHDRGLDVAPGALRVPSWQPLAPRSTLPLRPRGVLLRRAHPPCDRSGLPSSALPRRIAGLPGDRGPRAGALQRATPRTVAALLDERDRIGRDRTFAVGGSSQPGAGWTPPSRRSLR